MHTSEQVSVAAHAQLSQPAEAICCMLHLNRTFQMSLSTAKDAHLNSTELCLLCSAASACRRLM